MMCNDCGWEDALADAENLLRKLDDLPERAEEFAVSVQATLESMAGWIEEHEHVTEKQNAALDNIDDAIDRWMGRP
jgi:hypothetical protein